MERIAHYRILGELGRGAAGLVYRAHDPALGREVAIKVLHAPERTAEGRRQLKRFAREARALAKIDHPNVIRIHMAGEHEGRPFLVMDLVEGRTLQQVLKHDGPLPLRRAVDMTHRLALGLAQAHAQGILHRDLKPSNVLLDQAGSPRLTDFGLAKDLASESQSISVSGMVLGTPGYWPPEQAAGIRGEIGPASDVYGLGSILYAALTGKPPVDRGSTLEDMVIATVDYEPVAPSQDRADVDERLDAICMRCLAKLPEDRYRDAAELAAVLGEYLGAERVRPTPRRRGSLGHPALWAAGGALSSSLLLGLLWALFGSGPAKPPALPPKPAPTRPPPVDPGPPPAPPITTPPTPEPPPADPPPAEPPPPREQEPNRALPAVGPFDPHARDRLHSEPLSGAAIARVLAAFPFDRSPETSFDEVKRMIAWLGPTESWEEEDGCIAARFGSSYLTLWDDSHNERTAYSLRHGPTRRDHWRSNETYQEILKPQVLEDGATLRASHCWRGDRVRAVFDGRIDGPPLMTWRDRRGSREWIEVAFPKERTVSMVLIAWAVSERRDLALPLRWRMLVREAEDWKPLRLLPGERYRLSEVTRVRFRPTTTDRIRLEVDLPADASSGVSEWQLE